MAIGGQQMTKRCTSSRLWSVRRWPTAIATKMRCNPWLAWCWAWCWYALALVGNHSCAQRGTSKNDSYGTCVIMPTTRTHCVHWMP
eukprot:11219945-Lingulodinium_polyedra.AAC.1